MNIEFTGRHIDVTPAIKSHVEEHFKRLDHIFDGKPANAHVIIEIDHGMSRSEVVLNWRNEVLTANTTIAAPRQSHGSASLPSFQRARQRDYPHRERNG